MRNIESQKDWISFVARHVVLMLTQAPSCPSLTRQQTSKVGQDLYFEMLPLLKAASMTLQDMGIQYSGPGVDGRTAIGTIQSVGTYRILSALDSVAGGKESKDTNSSLMMTTTADKLFGGFLLPFGAGLPHGGVQTLSWQIEEVKRDYAKPWNDYLDPAKTQSQKPGSPLITDEDEDDKCRFFLTGEGRSLNVRSNSSSPTAKRGPLVSPSSNVRPPVFRMDDDESKLLSMSSPRIDQPDQRLPEPHIRAGMLAVRSKSRSFSFEGEDVRIFTDTLNSASLISRGKIGPLSDRSTLSALPSLIEGCDRTIWTPTKSRTSIAMAGDDLLSIRTGNSDLVDIEAMSKSIALVSIPHTTSDHQFAQMRIFNTDDMDLIDPTTESVRLQPSLGVGEKRMSLRPIVTDLTDEEHRLNSKESASDDKIETSSFVPKLTSLDQPNDGDYLYDFRRSTENKDTKKMSQIAGFSADINWESTFLLAPVGKVSQYNNQVPRSAGWESIEKPPVVAMTNNCARIPISHAGDDLLASSSNKLLTTKILSRVTFSSAENGEHENSFTDNVRRSKVDVASIDDIPSQTVVINPIDLQSTETQSNHNGRASNAEEVISEYKTATSFYQIENQHQKPKLEVSVGEVAKRGAVPQQIFTRTERKIQQGKEHFSSFHTLVFLLR